VARAPIGDRLIRALATIDELQETIGKHTQILSKIADKMAEMDKRLTAVERPSSLDRWIPSAMAARD
jgi:uncharacterized coiled-coil protein SlyX